MDKTEKIYHVESLDKLKNFGLTKVVAAIGVFDGIHLGHRKLIHTLLEMSEKLKSDPIIITFHPHPRVVLQHDENLRFLRNPEKKNEILQNLGIKAVVTIPFSREFASLPPNDFIEHFLMPEEVKLSGICVGSEWRFGNKAAGNSETLHKFAGKYGFKFKAVDELYRNNILISSTAIRNALKQGDFKTANFMLDCIYSITGKVENIQSQPSLYSKLTVNVEYGILPPVGQYNIFIRKNKDRIKSYANVLSEDKTEIFYPKLDSRIDTVEFEFIEKI